MKQLGRATEPSRKHSLATPHDRRTEQYYGRESMFVVLEVVVWLVGDAVCLLFFAVMARCVAVITGDGVSGSLMFYQVSGETIIILIS
jgi:hypothetical protein